VLSQYKRLTFDTGTGAYLVFPLRRHDLCIDTGDLDSRIKTGLVVSLDDISAVNISSPDSAVVWALGTGETALGPAIWPPIWREEGVLLLEAEPQLMLLVGLHQAGCLVTVVELVGAPIWIPGFTENEDVW
jgi:hypothetical protein